MQQHRYKTTVIGKWHLWSNPTGFDYWNVLPAHGHCYNPAFINMGKDTSYTGYVTDLITGLSLAWIEKHKRLAQRSVLSLLRKVVRTYSALWHQNSPLQADAFQDPIDA